VRILVLPLLLLLLLPCCSQAGAGIVLSDVCPPGFELSAGQCELRSLYQMYASLENAGVGGLKTGLPNYRDGFTPQQTDLGRYLFFDPVMSGDGSLSCASCHNPDKGFADGRARSLGAGGKLLPRSAPTLWNVAFSQRFFWDARAASLEEQMLGPLYDQNEMANSRENLLATRNAIPANAL
jgi:cytochrome c peroxidase